MDGWALIHTLSSNNSTFQWGCCQMFWFWMRCGPSWLYCTFQQILLSVPRPLSGPYGAGVTLLPVDWRGFWQYLKYVFVFSIQQRKELAWNGFLFCLYAFWKAHIFLKKCTRVGVWTRSVYSELSLRQQVLEIIWQNAQINLQKSMIKGQIHPQTFREKYLCSSFSQQTFLNQIIFMWIPSVIELMLRKREIILNL